jgi:hypothetical protein|tara:strand:- start:275 stop:565 length:291 start_codon:yes stop_codon:yes gene_type:complete
MDFFRKMIIITTVTSLFIGTNVYINKEVKEIVNVIDVDLRSEILELKSVIEENSNKCNLLYGGMLYLQQELESTQRQLRIEKIAEEKELKTILTEK